MGETINVMLPACPMHSHITSPHHITPQHTRTHTHTHTHIVSCCPPHPALFAWQTPLLTIALHKYNGSFREINIGLLIAGLPLLVSPLFLKRWLSQPYVAPISQ